MIQPEVAKAAAEGFAIGITAGLSSTAVIIVVAIFVWVKYTNNVKLVFAQVWSILSYVLGVFADRHYVVNHLEGKVGKGIQNIIKKIDGLEAENIKIILVRNVVREAFIRDRVLLMRIQKKENHEENLANIAYIYSEHLYSRIHPSLNRIQQEGIELYTAKSILKFGGGEGIRHLDEKYYRPLISRYPNLQMLLNRLEAIDNKGLFYSVFIQEMVFLGEKTMFRRNIRGVHEEVSHFVQFLADFTSRTQGDTSVSMDFRSSNIKVSFILVALRSKRESEDTQSYIHRVQTLPRDIESLYFMGWGKNIMFVQQVVSEVVRSVGYLELKKEREYERFFEDGHSVDAVCILVRNRRIANLAQ